MENIELGFVQNHNDGISFIQVRKALEDKVINQELLFKIIDLSMIDIDSAVLALIHDVYLRATSKEVRKKYEESASKVRQHRVFNG